MFEVHIVSRNDETSVMLGSFGTIENARHAQAMVQGTLMGTFPESYYRRGEYKVTVTQVRWLDDEKVSTEV